MFAFSYRTRISTVLLLGLAFATSARADDMPPEQVACNQLAADPRDADNIDFEGQESIRPEHAEAAVAACAQADWASKEGRNCAGDANVEACTLVSSDCLRAPASTAQADLQSCTRGVTVDPSLRRFTYQLGRALEARDREFVGRAIPIYLQAAKAGSVAAMEQLGHDYMTMDFAKARFWYERAAREGSASSMEALGDIHANGMGVPVDPDKARELYAKAAKKGRSSAAEKLTNHWHRSRS